ncbi:MAG: DUF4258 domain-containing protein [Sphingobacteriales bacterium]|nr:DUF4258 domain-containing protein [Sphingobacteriales bacterium]
MFKKYLPFLFLIASALLFIYVKMNQVGVAPHRNNNTTDHFTIPAVLPPSENPNRVEDGFDRRNNHLLYSKHARCRMECRHIDESEVKEILESGTINYSKIEDDGRGKSFPLEGITHDKQHVRIVFAPKDDGMLVVTCIDLDRDWPCECR